LLTPSARAFEQSDDHVSVDGPVGVNTPVDPDVVPEALITTADGDGEGEAVTLAAGAAFTAPLQPASSTTTGTATAASLRIAASVHPPHPPRQGIANMTRSRSWSAQQPQSLFDHIAKTLTVTTEGGVPDVSDLPSDLIEQAGEPYMRRYYLLGSSPQVPGSKARFHQILASDLADLHDHPWDFVSVILSGSYVETTPTSEQEFGPGSVLVRTAEQLHRLSLPNGPVWTFIMVGPARRRWGFATDDGWVHWSEYLKR
jgi:hypothetical protein